jgi:hypothetical protein
MRHLHLLALGAFACSGGDPKDEDAAQPPADADADTDTDADADADSDADTDSETGTDTETPPPQLSGPITPGLYVVYPLYAYIVAAPALVPPGTGTGTTGTTGDTGAPESNLVAFMRFDAIFGYDGDGHVIETTLNGDPIVSSFNVHLGTAAWETTSFSLDDTERYCTITFPMAGGTLAPWVAYTQRLWWGTEYASGPLPTTCDGSVDLTPLGDPVVDWANQIGIGAAVGGLLPSVHDLIQESFGDDIVYVFGGQFHFDPFFTSTVPIDDAYALVYEIDLATGALVLDPQNQLVLIEATDVYPYP